MATPTETGKAFLAGVIAKLPESVRAQAEATFAAAEADAALAELGSGVLRQADYSRSQDAVRARETELTQWHQQLADWQVTERDKMAVAIAEAQRASVGPAAPATPPVPAPPADVITREELKREFVGFGNLAGGVIAATVQIGLRHFADFNEPMNAEAVMSHPKVNDIGLEGAYREIYKEKLEKRAADLKAAEAKAIGEAAVSAYRSAHPNLPYPVNGQVQPSTLDTLGQTLDPALYGAEAAANLYQQLVAQKANQS